MQGSGAVPSINRVAFPGRLCPSFEMRNMKRLLSFGIAGCRFCITRFFLLSLVLVLFGGQLAWADEPPEMQLEFVKKLRARKMGALALEYLELLQKNPPVE